MGWQQHTNLHSCFAFAFVLALATGLVFEVLNKKLMEIVRCKPWCSQAMQLQKSLAMNFGYQEKDCTEEAMLDAYCFVLLFCFHHFLAGCALLPVVIMGWEASGFTGQLLFVLGVLSDVALDLFDSVKIFMRTFLHNHIPWGPPCPLAFFIILCCLHHPLAIGMVIPLVVHQPEMRSFHLIATALLLAAGICFLTGAYKFTLDVKSKRGFMQYKGIVLLQLVTILFTRGYIWFTQAYVTLSTFRSEGKTNFFIAGCVAASLMSLFNLVMIMDSIDAAKKWLPRPTPTGAEEGEEVEQEMVRQLSTQMNVPRYLTDVLSPEARRFRASATVLVAASKFKKGIPKRD